MIGDTPEAALDMFEHTLPDTPETRAVIATNRRYLTILRNMRNVKKRVG